MFVSCPLALDAAGTISIVRLEAASKRKRHRRTIHFCHSADKFRSPSKASTRTVLASTVLMPVRYLLNSNFRSCCCSALQLGLRIPRRLVLAACVSTYFLRSVAARFLDIHRIPNFILTQGFTKRCFSISLQSIIGL